MKVAIVTGVTGQDGSYLAELLLDKGYYVVGTKRRTSSPNYENITAVQSNPNFELVTADITDATSVSGLITKYQPDEIYNLAAQSFVKASFDQPYHTFEVDTLGVLNFLETLRQTGSRCRFYQASTSEMFGKNFMTEEVKNENCPSGPVPSGWLTCLDTNCPPYKTIKYQDESTTHMPQSPYGIAKMASHHLVRLYREAYGVQGACGILFNHESPRRGKEFVTRKITDYVARLSKSMYTLSDGTRVYGDIGFPKLKLGNLDAVRDWGHAKDYVEAQWMILQQEELEDFVICTGRSHSVRQFCSISFAHIGLNYEDWVEVDPAFYRPAEVDYLHGRAAKAEEKLGWKPKYTFDELVKDMVEADIRRHQ